MKGKNLSRRQFLTAAAGFTSLSVLAACAPAPAAAPAAAPPGEATAETPAEAPSAAGAAAAGGETIGKEGTPQWTAPNLAGKQYTFWGLQYDPHVQTYKRLTDHFELFTGAKATVEPQSTDIGTGVIAAMAAGMAPDVVCFMGQACPPLVLQDALINVDDLVNSSMGINTQEWYSPVAIQAYQLVGKTYGVPVEGNAVSGFVNIRMDFLKEAGAEVEKMWPPNQEKSGFESFEEMWELAKRLQKTESDGTVSRWGLSSRGWDSRHLLGIMRTLGRDWWDPASREFFLDSPEAVQAMQLQVTRPVFDLKIETQLDTSFVEAVGAGKVAVGCGNVVLPGLHQAMGIVEDSCIYPSAVEGKKPLFVGEGGWGFVVPKQAKERDVAIEFLKYMSTYDGQKDYNAIYGGMIPAAPLVGDDPELFPTTNYVGRSINRVAPTQWDTVYFGEDFGTPGEMNEIIGTKVDEVRGGTLQPEEACQQAQALLEDMLKRWDEEKKKVSG